MFNLFKSNKSNRSAGFTLIEILVVIGIIAILATIVIIAINPARQFAQGRNTQRVSHLNTILNAVGQHLADNKGLPINTTTCPGLGTTIGCPSCASPTASTTIGTGAGNSNLQSCLVPTYIPSQVPVDPTDGTPENTKYEISVNAVGRYMLCAQNTESALGNPENCVTR